MSTMTQAHTGAAQAVLQAIDAERLWNRVQALAHYTDPQRPWTRRAFTDLHLQSRHWLEQQMQAAGLSTRLDAGGNLCGLRQGSEPEAKPVITGSHCDTVVEGGRYDGIIGVLAGIEIAHAMQDAGVCVARNLEVIDFLSEEPSDYGISCVGSRAMAGLLTPAMLASTNAQGETLAQGMQRIGARPDLLGSALRPADSVAAFLELHIEQGPVLETEQIQIGVVSHIVGIRRVQIRLQGRPDHAGTTPMGLRADALVAAARVIEACYDLAQQWQSPDRYVVATVGYIDVSPNVANAVPGQVDLVLEVRSDDDSVLASFVETLLENVQPRVQQVRAQIQSRALSLAPPTACDAGLMALIGAQAQHLGYTQRVLPSGAGHDAAYMSVCGPMGMIFVPCLDGRSHCPEESLTAEQLYQGTRVLAASLCQIAAIV